MVFNAENLYCVLSNALRVPTRAVENAGNLKNLCEQQFPGQERIGSTVPYLRSDVALAIALDEIRINYGLDIPLEDIGKPYVDMMMNSRLAKV